MLYSWDAPNEDSNIETNYQLSELHLKNVPSKEKLLEKGQNEWSKIGHNFKRKYRILQMDFSHKELDSLDLLYLHGLLTRTQNFTQDG